MDTVGFWCKVLVLFGLGEIFGGWGVDMLDLGRFEGLNLSLWARGCA